MVDGVNYAVPTALSMASTGQVIGFRGDGMQNLGYELEPVPGTDFYAGPDSLDEIKRLLLAFRNEDPDGNGRKDSYGYAVWKNNDAFQRTILPRRVRRLRRAVECLGCARRQWLLLDGGSRLPGRR